jgi:hypothetical protein
VEDFARDRAAAVPKGWLPFGKRKLFRCRGNRRSTLQQRLREATYSDLQVDATR